MGSTQWSQDAEAGLSARGLTFETFEAPEGALSFRHPAGWRGEFREDHAVCRHGVPPEGFLTVFPVPRPEGGAGEGLLVAFLDEFVAPAVSNLNLKQLGPLPEEGGLTGAVFTLELAGKTHEGVALTATLRGLPVIAAYWCEARLFRKPLVTALLKATLGSTDVAPAGALAPPLPEGISPLLPGDLWPEAPPEGGQPLGDAQSRFALKIPPELEAHRVESEGSRMWIFTPAGKDPSDPAIDHLIALTGEDLFGDLDATLEDAKDALDPEGRLRLELTPLHIEEDGREALIRVYIEHPEAKGAPIRRLLSAGFSNGESVVHLAAIAEARRIRELIPPLQTLIRSLRVLPRPIDGPAMKAFAGRWHFQERTTPGDMHVATEHRYDLRPDGRFTLEVEDTFIVDPGPTGDGDHAPAITPAALKALTPSPEMGAGPLPPRQDAPETVTSETVTSETVAPEIDAPEPSPWLAAAGGGDPTPAQAEEDAPSEGIRRMEGSWYITGERITWRFDEGGVLIRSIDTLTPRMAILEGVFWKRMDAAGEPPR